MNNQNNQIKTGMKQGIAQKMMGMAGNVGSAIGNAIKPQVANAQVPNNKNYEMYQTPNGTSYMIVKGSYRPSSADSDPAVTSKMTQDEIMVPFENKDNYSPSNPRDVFSNPSDFGSQDPNSDVVKKVRDAVNHYASMRNGKVPMVDSRVATQGNSAIYGFNHDNIESGNSYHTNDNFPPVEYQKKFDLNGAPFPLNKWNSSTSTPSGHPIGI